MLCVYNLGLSFTDVEILDGCCISQPAKVSWMERSFCKWGFFCFLFCHGQMINNWINCARGWASCITQAHLGFRLGQSHLEEKNQTQKANRKLCTAWIISPNSLSSMSRGQFITVLSNSGLKKGCLKYNFLLGADSYKDSVNVPLCVKLLSSGCQTRNMSQAVADFAGMWLHRQNNVICKVTVTH